MGVDSFLICRFCFRFDFGERDVCMGFFTMGYLEFLDILFWMCFLDSCFDFFGVLKLFLYGFGVCYFLFRLFVGGRGGGFFKESFISMNSIGRVVSGVRCV